MSTFSIGLSGLNASSQNLNGISQNIANSSTAGFKSLSTTFAANYSGSQASGVEVSSSTQSFDDEGDLTATSDNLDVAISGKGFFILDDGTGSNVYARSGDFHLDNNNNLVAINGMNVQGYGIDSAGNINSGSMSNLKITNTSIPAKATSAVDITANLNSSATAITSTFDPTNSATYNYSQQSTVYDSLGESHTLTTYYVKTGDNQWSLHYAIDGNTLTSTSTSTDSSGNTTTTTSTKTDTLTFDSNGVLASVNGTTASATSSLSISSSLSNGASALDLKINLWDSDSNSAAITQYSSSFTNTSSADGYSSGNFTSAYFDKDGYLWAKYDNGQTLKQGQLVMASFTNPDGLEAASGTIWTATSDSGSPVLGTTGIGSLGTLTVGSYEGSNVDISSQLVSLMSAQQNYQANAKVISTASDLSSVLFNM